MKGLPAELVYALIFVGILLFQYVTRRAGRRARREAPQDAAQDVTVSRLPDEAYPEFLEPEPGPAPEPAASADWSTWGSAPVPVRRPEPRIASPALPRRRFGRKALLGSRRAVQNAVVLAAILGPCRAFEPHDVR